MDETLSKLTLREQKHYEATTHVVAVALELFDTQGYQSTTIAQITKAAGISEATFYRWFGTKEGIISTAPLRNQTGSALTRIIDVDDIAGSLDRLAHLDFPGIRYVMEEPAVRAAVHTELDHYSAELSEQLENRGHSPLAARTIARSLLFGVYFSSLEHWYRGGKHQLLSTIFTDALTSTGLVQQLKKR